MSNIELSPNNQRSDIKAFIDEVFTHRQAQAVNAPADQMSANDAAIDKMVRRLSWQAEISVTKQVPSGSK